MSLYNSELIKKYIQFNPTTFKNKEYAKPPTDRIYIDMVYFLYNVIKNIPCLVYVGQTARGFDRIQEHRLEKQPFDVWNYLSVPYDYLRAVELYYIQKCMPCLNYRDNPLYMRHNGQYFTSSQEFKDIRHRLIDRINCLKAMGDSATHGKDFIINYCDDTKEFVRFSPYIFQTI